MYSEDADTIKQRILDNMSSNVDKTIGYLAYDSAAALGKELSSNRSFLDQILACAFPQTSSGKYLDYNAESRGLKRNLGVKAIGQVTFSGVDNILIPKGFVVQTSGGLQYTVDSDVVIAGGVATANITASDIGTNYNVPRGVINQIPVQMNGVISVTNTNPTTSGTDDETDAQLIARLLEKVQNPPSCGNKTDYERWGKEVAGVVNVKVIPLWNGNGTVKLIVSGENGSPLDSTILSNVKNYIDPGNGSGEGQAPIGATVTIATVTLTNIDVSVVGLQIKDGFTVDSVKINIQSALTSYLNNLSSGSLLKYNDIRAAFTLVTGVYDFTDFKINNSTSNIQLNVDIKATLGNLTYS